MRTINAALFKATCLAILDDADRTGERVVILKRGRPVAELVRPTKRGRAHPQHGLAGSVEFVGDVVDPALPPSAWNATKGELR